MLTLEKLAAFGADTKSGLQRCVNSEAMYLRFVGMVTEDRNFEELAQAIAENDQERAFRAAHALKGVLSNLSLTPILDPVSEMTELLRAGTKTDYGPLLAEVLDRREALRALSAS